MSNRQRYRSGTTWAKLRRAVMYSEDTCGLCGRLVDKTLMSPHPMSPEIDHIVPAAQGGDLMARSNLQLSHRRCNRSKGDGSRVVPPNPTSRAW